MTTTSHLEILESGIVPDDYLKQVQAALACTGRQWCDFVSFDPRLPAELQYFCVRITRDEPFIARIEAAVVKFLDEIDRAIADLHAGKRREPAKAIDKPKPAAAAKPKAQLVTTPPGSARRPLIGDRNPDGSLVFENYQAWHDANDLWLLKESVRLVLTAIEERSQAALLNAPTIHEVQTAARKRRLLN